MDIFEAEVARRFVVAVEKIANALELYVSTQTETQNSNLTFEKRTMRDCYNCERYEPEDECIECHYEPKDECAKEYEELGLKELKELIEADRKTENSSEKPNNCEELNAYRECVKSRSFWDSKHCDGCYFDERCPFDEPMDEPQKKEVEWVYNKRERLWYPYLNGELLFKDEPQTERSE